NNIERVKGTTLEKANILLSEDPLDGPGLKPLLVEIPNARPLKAQTTDPASHNQNGFGEQLVKARFDNTAEKGKENSLMTLKARTQDGPLASQRSISLPTLETSSARANKNGSVQKKSPSKDYAIQVSSLKNLRDAELLKSKLTDQGYPAYIYSAELPGKGTQHRVRIGGYKSKEEAERTARKLRAEGKFSPYVTQRVDEKGMN
ncbi:MAG: SPOR domain-containing protein, partial [Candidatus Tectomicrobia bacterium]|nr:SPOR domain-containing protein [Candidatus Tectomicrobia bacterium]